MLHGDFPAMAFPFNLRAYGVARHMGRVLVAEEPFQGSFVTKFPGGGVAFGEGPEDTLAREFREELDQSVQNLGHLYTTGHFVPSLRGPEEQLVAIYYAVALPSPQAAAPLDGSVREVRIPKDNPQARQTDASRDAEKGARPHRSDPSLWNRIRFRWLPLRTLRPEVFDLPVDRLVARRFLCRP